MKNLSFGILTLFAWMAFSSYIYVCKIQGLCGGAEAIEIEAVTPENIITDDIIPEPLVEEVAEIPKDLVIHFAFDKSEFKPGSETDNFILASKAYMDENNQAMLVFTGHTCATGTDAYNQALGLRRAQSIQQYFESRGMSASKSKIESKGEKEPVDDNNTKSGRENNRRTVVTIKK